MFLNSKKSCLKETVVPLVLFDDLLALMIKSACQSIKENVSKEQMINYIYEEDTETNLC